MDKGRWRLAGVILLLAVQAALAAFLAFIATIHDEDRRRFGQYLDPPYTPTPEIAPRVYLETTAVILDAVYAISFVATFFATLASVGRPLAVRRVQRLYGRTCLIAGFLMFLVAFFVPHIRGSHTDLFPGLGHLLSAVTMLLLGGAALGVARLLRAPTDSGGTGSAAGDG